MVLETTGGSRNDCVWREVNESGHERGCNRTEDPRSPLLRGASRAASAVASAVSFSLTYKNYHSSKPPEKTTSTYSRQSSKRANTNSTTRPLSAWATPPKESPLQDSPTPDNRFALSRPF